MRHLAGCTRLTGFLGSGVIRCNTGHLHKIFSDLVMVLPYWATFHYFRLGIIVLGWLTNFGVVGVGTVLKHAVILLLYRHKVSKCHCVHSYY